MSANRDRDQRVTFVYSNFYQLYKKGKEAASTSPATPLSNPFSGQSSAVLKAGDRRVQNYEPIALMAKHAKAAAVPKLVPQSPVALPVQAASLTKQSSPTFQNAAVDSLKENLKTLNDLHSRLNFMLKELEELVSE